MTTTMTPLLFVHGFWHGSWCWSEVLAHVADSGRQALAVDLAGHGLRARRPESVTARPFSAEGLATEKSPVADVDLDQAGDLLVSQIRRLGRGGPVTVVAHSMGGSVLTRAAEQAPELVAHAVYLAAFMPASGVSAMECAMMPENAGELIAPSVRADPMAVGALRLDTISTEPEYRDQLRRAFYGDLDPADADAALGLLTPDAPAGIALGSTTLTGDGWGSVPRTYVGCAQDMTIRPPLQRKFIDDADAAFPGNPTLTLGLDSAHSPFLSMPDRVAEIVAGLG
ncbi:alpha/beta hydrolase [Spongiactinospora rosea]|uniref:Alpha/beta hydrolase n=2 Tax=Spongiactinospora rosea TaxID=2248750 RepID=A0A366LQB6_9ACTN|nr:alpha/beta hydrolase [Spongiactinospora rosea]